jgi:orotidine-5'-phosphate decarboxylase
MSAGQGFNDKVLACAERNSSWVCVGLDPAPDRMPSGFRPEPADVLRFNRAIIDATSDLVCAYKPNLAFYEWMGAEGWTALRETIRSVPAHVAVILDAKRGDIGNTAAMYAKALFEDLEGDAATVSPFLGTDSVEPFLRHREKGVIVLCLTSNPGARELQIKNNLHLQVAELSNAWACTNGNVGLVVGATQAAQLRAIRGICPDRLFLVPGIGAQGGDLAETVRAGAGRDRLRLIINAARSIIHADAGPEFAQAARRETQRLRDGINHVYSQPVA